MLDWIDSNTPYEVSQTVTVSSTSGSVDGGTLRASASGNIEAGAFNIFDQIVSANQFLATTTASCGSYECETLATAAKAHVYWAPGVDPNERLTGVSFAPLSFVATSLEPVSMFILGGVDGDTTIRDTDHFDNSVILHEYAHFLEYTYSAFDSKGGPHDGDSILDPRLAWSEGFANFFQAAVTGDPTYIDTIGNCEGSTGFGFYETLETAAGDIASESGEGNFREFSVSRALWDYIDPHPIEGTGTNESGIDNVTLDFAAIWSVFTSENLGLKNANLALRNYGTFANLLVQVDNGSSDIQSVLTAENQKASEEDFAQSLAVTGSDCASVFIQGDPNQGTLDSTNLFTSNDFYKINHTGGDLSVSLQYTPVNSSAYTDLDLYIYSSEFFGVEYTRESEGLLARSELPFTSENGTETLTLSDRAAGTYVINVRVSANTVTQVGSNYQLYLGGQRLCDND